MTAQPLSGTHHSTANGWFAVASILFISWTLVGCQPPKPADATPKQYDIID